MERTEIIKALECCDGTLAGCEDCPYNKDGIGCKYRLPTDALALIKSLLGEIRGLNSAIETLQGVVKDYEHRNENLVNENKYLRESLADEREHKEDIEGK